MLCQRPLLVLLLLFGGLALGQGNDNQPTQWTVLSKSLTVRKAPRQDAEAITTVAEGTPLEQIDGESSGWLKVHCAEASGYVPEALVLKSVSIQTDPSGNLPIGKETVDKQTPLPLDYKPDDLVELPGRWNYHSEGAKRLRRVAAEAAKDMFEAARRDKIELRVVSAYRSAKQQKFLYLRKIRKAGIDQKLVAKPGHSEHQLGTTIDVSGLDPKTVLRQTFANSPEGKWLRDNAERFGFRFTYTEATREKTGFRPEPWHIRFMGRPDDKENKEPAMPE